MRKNLQCKSFISCFQQSEQILEINGNEYLTLVPTNESIEKIKKYEELWCKIRDLIRSITKNSDDYDEKYMKIKFNLDNNLPLKQSDRNSQHDNSCKNYFS